MLEGLLCEETWQKKRDTLIEFGNGQADTCASFFFFFFLGGGELLENYYCYFNPFRPSGSCTFADEESLNPVLETGQFHPVDKGNEDVHPFTSLRLREVNRSG